MSAPINQVTFPLCDVIRELEKSVIILYKALPQGEIELEGKTYLSLEYTTQLLTSLYNRCKRP